jgi:hypothetical protein
MKKGSKKEIKPEKTEEKQFFSLGEAAEYFGVNVEAIKLWIAHGKLTTLSEAGYTKIPMESIKSFRLLGHSKVIRGAIQG